MSKIYESLTKESAITARKRLLYDYGEKYFNLWLGSWKWNGLSRHQREYLMRKFWENGQVAAFDIVKAGKPFLGGITPAELASKDDNAFLGFATFAAIGYNMYNYPTRVQLINERGTPYIPSTPLTNEVDVVLGFAQHSRQPIRAIVNDYIERIVDVEMTIRTNLIAQKIPVVYEVGPDSLQHGEDFTRKLLNDEPVFFTNVKEVDSLKAATANIPFNVASLYGYKVNLENELNTFLGIDNIGNVEKKERLITDEAQSNDNIINDFSDNIGDNLKEFCDLVGSVLGYTISVEPKNSPKEANESAPAPKGDPNDGNENMV